MRSDHLTHVDDKEFVTKKGSIRFKGTLSPPVSVSDIDRSSSRASRRSSWNVKNYCFQRLTGNCKSCKNHKESKHQQQDLPLSAGSSITMTNDTCRNDSIIAPKMSTSIYERSPAQLPTPDNSLPPSEDGDCHPKLMLDDSDIKLNGEPAAEWLRLPDSLFYSIMSAEPEVNPLYHESKTLSDPWVASTLGLSTAHAKKWAKLDIAYMSAICAPRADLEVLKLMNDWNGWVFAFDDPFDEGAYASKPLLAAEEVINSLAVLDDTHPPVNQDENPVRFALQSVWQRFRARAPRDLQARWKRQLTTYAIGVLRQVDVQNRPKEERKKQTVEEYMEYRAGCVGAYPCLGLMELAEGIDLPHEVVDHPSLAGIARVAVDLVTLQNDICSYKKDLDTGEDANLIFLLRDQGMTTQEAADRIGQLLHDCYRRWYKHLAELPYWGGNIDRQVLKYIEGCRNLGLGNLTWSLYTPRYVGDQAEQIKETRMIRLK